jgi:glycosyltransferase involved in cell wall biosynthesis
LKKKKILYISNVNLDGLFLPGVIHKIKGQEKAFKNEGYEIDLLYPGDNNAINIKKNNDEMLFFKGARTTYKGGGIFSKSIKHFQISWHGDIDFTDCLGAITAANYEAIYLRFYIPGKDLIGFLKKIKKACPNIIILLEYPTLNIKKLFRTSFTRRISYFINHNRIERLNQLSDFFITLTKDKTLFGKPAIFMPNGIALDDIQPVPVPAINDKIVLLGVASDCAFYHGFDKVIKGLSVYVKEKKLIKVVFRIVSSPLSRNVDYLKNLAKELGVEDDVSFELPKSRLELAGEYKAVHIGMGTLALHRVGLMDNYSLKHREYAAFGLPFIMSMGDDQFESSPFVLTVDRDDEPLDIQSVVDFYLSLRKNYPFYPQEFRKSVERVITWDAQMKNVFEVINKI